MTIDDILTLARAGFTAQQIAAMTVPAQPEATPAPASPAAAQNPAPSNPPAAPAAEPETAPNPTDPTPAPEVMPDLMAALNQRLDDFINTFRGQLNPSINDIKPLGVEDVIAKILKEE
jgi:hypothetical protein